MNQLEYNEEAEIVIDDDIRDDSEFEIATENMEQAHIDEKPVKEKISENKDLVEEKSIFVPYEKRKRTALASLVILIGVIFFNLTFVLGPAIGVWAVLLSLFISGGALVIESIRMIVVSSVGVNVFSGLSEITIFSQIGFYLCFGLFLVLVIWKLTNLIWKLSMKYIKFNGQLIRGE